MNDEEFLTFQQRLAKAEAELKLLRVAGDIKTEQWEKAQARAEKAEVEVRRLQDQIIEANTNSIKARVEVRRVLATVYRVICDGHCPQDVITGIRAMLQAALEGGEK